MLSTQTKSTIKYIARILMVGFLLSNIYGCASIIGNPTREIVVDTPAGVKVQAQLDIDRNQYDIELPMILDIHRGVQKELKIHIKSLCENTSTRRVPREVSTLTFANGPGLFGYLVDAYTGAATQYRAYNLAQIDSINDCKDNDLNLSKITSFSKLSEAEFPSNGKGWKVGGILIAQIGAFITAKNTAGLIIENNNGSSTIDISPVIAGLIIGGGMYYYGEIKSDEYAQWKRKRFQNILNIGVLINTDSGVRLHYRKNF